MTVTADQVLAGVGLILVRADGKLNPVTADSTAAPHEGHTVGPPRIRPCEFIMLLPTPGDRTRFPILCLVCPAISTWMAAR